MGSVFGSMKYVLGTFVFGTEQVTALASVCFPSGSLLLEMKHGKHKQQEQSEGVSPSFYDWGEN